MSESLALNPAAAPGEKSVKVRFSFGALFGRFMESLVSAQRRRFEDSDPLMYRFPPL